MNNFGIYVMDNFDKKLEEHIQSELKFVWTLIYHILLSPITLILVLLKKKRMSDLTKPFRLVRNFFFAARFTSNIILINLFLFPIWFFLPDQWFNFFVSHPSDLITFHWHTLITSGFMHSDVFHLAGNMLAIFIFGRIVERKVGTRQTALIYFLALILSGIFSSLIHLLIIGDNVGGVGASGALMGLVSAAILFDPLYITHLLLFPLPVMLVGWLTIYSDITGILNPIEDGIGHFAHLGGFLSISIITFLLNTKMRKRLKKGFIVNIVSLIVFIVVMMLK